MFFFKEKKNDVTSNWGAVCHAQVFFFFLPDCEFPKKKMLQYDQRTLVYVSTHEERRPCSTGHTCRLQKGTHNDCFSCFDLSTVFQMDKEWFVLYTQDIWREREMEIINAHGPKKYTCQQKHAKCNMHFIHLVLINLLFRGKHECLGRQLLWPFSVLGIFWESL